MASEEILPGSALNQVPLEQQADPQHTDSANSVSAKPFKQHNSSSPSPPAQVPLQVHVPAGLAAHPHAAARTLPGGLLAQSPYAPHIPASQAGLMPFPYGQQLIAAAAPRGLGGYPGMQAGMAAPQMMLPGGGLIRHPRRTMPVSHPYQRMQAMPGAAAQPVQQYQMLAASRAVAPQQQTIIQTPYGLMQMPMSSAGLQYRLPAAPPQQAQPQMSAMGMDPAMAALYGQYQQQAAYPAAYMQQFQQPSMAALAAQYGAAAQYGMQPQYLSAAVSREQQQQQQLAAAYARAGAGGEQQQYYDPQKLLNAHYAQLLMPEQNNSPAANGNTQEYSDQET